MSDLKIKKVESYWKLEAVIGDSHGGDDCTRTTMHDTFEDLKEAIKELDKDYYSYARKFYKVDEYERYYERVEEED